MSSARRLVFAAGIGLCVIWIFAHRTFLLAPEQHGVVRLSLSALMAILLIIRPKPATDDPPARTGVILLAGLLGMAAVVGGLLVDVGQIEWLGVLLVLWACLRWSMPDRAAKDVLFALLLIYWAHPLPTQCFGPLQLFMQRASVRGSEWLLLALDARAWADGLVLRTGFSVYEVPAWCSGMRAATTVFILSLGLAILGRFRWRVCAVIVLAALAQALVLNILRISAMVLLVPKLPDQTSIDFLHDTAGGIVLMAVVLVYAEIMLWRRNRIRDRAKLEAHTHMDSRHARVWQSVGRLRLTVLGTIVITVLAGIGLYRNRPSARAIVLKEITAAARDADNYEEALYLARTVEARHKDAIDEDWKMMKLRLLLMLQRFDELLVEIGSIDPTTDIMAEEKRVLKGYALMAQGHLDDAAEVIASLPDSIKQTNPRVAMILAQVAYEHDDGEAVARHIRVAAGWVPNMNRISLLYPFLRTHRQWQAIVDTDKLPHYDHPSVALSVTEAYMHLNKTFDVAQLTQTAASEWPTDVRVLEPLFYMSVRRPDSDWENRFADHFYNVIRNTRNIDELYLLFGKCFDLARPDLAWALYMRIQEIDPLHPVLEMSKVLHGGNWFVFRRRFLGLAGSSPTDQIDLRPFFWMGRTLNTWRQHCNRIPHGAPLAAKDPVGYRKACLKTAIQQFQTRREEGTLSIAMRYLFVEALDIEDDGDRWHQELRAIAEDHPGEAERVRISLSEIYERRQDWQNVYETLRGYADGDSPQLNALLRLCTAQRELRLAPASLHSAHLAHSLYPGSARAKSAIAQALFLNNMPEQAAFVLEQSDARHLREHDELYARALYETERFRAMEDFCNAALLGAPPIDESTLQRHVLPPAELALIWNHAFLPPESNFQQNERVLAFNRSTTTSPFLASLFDVWLACYHQDAEGDTANLARWEDCGRDNREKAVALNQLTLLLCRSEKFSAAAEAAVRASTLLPSSPVLWRWTISLSREREPFIESARRHCPDDPELWLADLSLAVRDTDDARLAKLVAEPDEQDTITFHAEALTRASEVLFRHGKVDEAGTIARLATARANGLLPAYIQGLHCALQLQDREWAKACANLALGAAVRPRSSLYRKLVELKTVDTVETDSTMVNALKQLRLQEPDNPLWAEILGYVRYKRGGWEITDSVSQFVDALEIGSTNRMTYMLAAETSSLMKNYERACDILANAVEKFPGDLEIKNNLAYALTYLPERAQFATDIADELVLKSPGNTNFLDTAATVYLYAGQTNLAQETLQLLDGLVEKYSPNWLRARSIEARLLARDHQYARAIALLQESIGASRMSDVREENLGSYRQYLDAWEQNLKKVNEQGPQQNQRPALTIEQDASE